LASARRYDEAIQQLRNIIELEPSFGTAHFFLGVTYTAKGMYREAIEAYRKAISIDGKPTSILCFLGYALARSGRPDEAQVILDRLKTGREYVSPAELAALYVGLGIKRGAGLAGASLRRARPSDAVPHSRPALR